MKHEESRMIDLKSQLEMNQDLNRVKEALFLIGKGRFDRCNKLKTAGYHSGHGFKTD